MADHRFPLGAYGWTHSSGPLGRVNRAVKSNGDRIRWQQAMMTA